MSAEIIPFKRPEPPAEDDTPHIAGQFFCMACDHEWQGVAPHQPGPLQYGSPNNPVQCPSCHAVRGYVKFDFMPAEGENVWSCTCENQLFVLTTTHIMCPCCGLKQVFPDFSK